MQTVRILDGAYRSTSVKVDARLTSDTPDRYIVVACRDQRLLLVPSNDYRLMIRPDRQEWWFGLSKVGKQEAFSGWAYSQHINSNGHNELRITCDGSQLSAWVNGVLLAQATDSQFSQGGVWIGVGSFANAGAAEARLDNLEVTQP